MTALIPRWHRTHSKASPSALKIAGAEMGVGSLRISVPASRSRGKVGPLDGLELSCTPPGYLSLPAMNWGRNAASGVLHLLLMSRPNVYTDAGYNRSHLHSLG